MMADIQAIIWKELKEMLHQGPRMRGGWLGVLIFLGVFGVLVPLQSGRGWVQAPETLLIWTWIPFFLVSSVVADSFAGERERHTLETLLASWLSDRAILLGKLGAVLVYGWGFTLLGVLLSLVTVNVAHASAGLLIFPSLIGWGIPIVSLLVAGFTAGLGVLISLRAPSVRQAQQTLSSIVFLVFIPILLYSFLPVSLKAGLSRLLGALPLSALIPAAAALLLLADVGLFLACQARFKRTRLILD